MVKPIVLNGHERALTQGKYNREGDLFFSCAKDSKPNVFYTINGERLGTFNGHKGVVWSLDPKWDTSLLITGSGDNSVKVWDISTGIQIAEKIYSSGVRTCVFSYSGNMAAISTDATYGLQCELVVLDVRNVDDSLRDASPIVQMPMEKGRSKITALVWGPLDKTIITGHEDGTLVQWDATTLREINSVKEHASSINDIQKNKDGTMFITASKDTTAKLFDIEDLTAMKTYTTERPVNSASISPIYDHVVVGGGQEAMEVTTTSTQAGKFDSRFYHLIFEEEFARIKGHFGPINTLAFHPDGKSFATGGEDGYIRINTFDEDYYSINFDY